MIAEPTPPPIPTFDSPEVKAAIAQMDAEWHTKRARQAALFDKDIGGPKNPHLTYRAPTATISDDATAAAVVVHPFFTALSGTDYTVESGTVGGITPTLGGDALDTLPQPTGTLSLSGTEYIYFKVSATITAAYGYAHTIVTNTVEVLDGSSIPADSKAAGVFYRKLATYVDGVKTSQDYSTSLSVSYCDDGTATGSVDLDLRQ